MNITGSTSYSSNDGGNCISGAFYRGSTSISGPSGGGKDNVQYFDASRSWTGSTSNNSSVSSVYGRYTDGIRPTSLGLKVKTRYY